ncbi:hypothetical protein [Methanoplanus limicola]|nr:hypothetical protein [Methanoplanus limicola]
MDSQLVSSPASPVNEQHNFIGGIEGTLSPQFRTSPEKMIVPMSNPPKAVKGHYLTIHSSADNDDNQYIEGIWETVSPKFRTPPENNDKLVRYATAGMADDLFVFKYEVFLTSALELDNFIEDDVRVFPRTEC